MCSSFPPTFLPHHFSFFFYFLTLQYCIGFAIYQHELEFRKMVTITLYTRQQKRHFSYFYFLTLLQSPYYSIVVALLTSA